MRCITASVWILLVLCSPHKGEGQRVVIRHGTPARVLDLLRAELLPQSFVLVSADEKGALFTLDRGLVIQDRGRGNAHVILELRVRYKPQADGAWR